MDTFIKCRLPILICLFTFGMIILSCNFLSDTTSPPAGPPGGVTPNTIIQGTSTTQKPALPTLANPSGPAAPTRAPVEERTGTPAGLESPTIPAAPTKPSQPVIVNTYMVSNMPGNKGGGPVGAMLALPGQVWTGTMFSGLQQWDPQSGKVVKTISNIGAKVFWDIKFDGKNLWVLTSDKGSTSYGDTLYVISLPEGTVVQKFDITGRDEFGYQPSQLGLSPGKVWVNERTIETDTFESNPLPHGLPSDAHFAYDGEQWMWITGSWCHGCNHALWLEDVNDPAKSKDDRGSGLPNDSLLGRPVALAGGKMWLVAARHEAPGNPNWFLQAYDIHKTDQPALKIDITRKFQGGNAQLFFAVDNRVLWLSINEILYYFDLSTGQELGSLPIGYHTEGIGFDGQSLWVLNLEQGLVQVALPWAP
jgi:hypothetical protein